MENYDGHRLSSEEAKTVPLSWNPFKRLGQLARYGAAFNLKHDGMSPLPLYVTRGDLVRVAESREYADQLLGITNQAQQRDQIQGEE